MTENKIRFQIRISQITSEQIAQNIEQANCKSKNEFVEKAILFYCGYLSSQNDAEYLTPLLAKVIQSSMRNSEDRVSRLLFKLAVEIAIMMNVLAAGLEVSEKDLEDLRYKCVQDVKRSRGSIKFSDAVDFQKGTVQ